MGLIRFLLACIVVIFHASPNGKFSPMPGNLSVQCFYIISGFYMTLVLNEKYTSHTTNLVFYTNRILKIYPIYFVVLIALIGWAALVYHLGYPGTFSFYHDLWPLPLGTLLYLIYINVFLVGFDSVFYFGINNSGRMFFTKDINKQTPYLVQFTFNSFAWTISVELLFYLIAPFILRKKIILPLIILVVSLLVRFYLIYIGLNYSPWNYMFFPSQIMFFMSGVISYHIYKKVNSNKPSKLYLIPFLVFIITIVFYRQFFNDSYMKQALLFILEIISIPYIFILTKSSKFDRFLGNLSFPIYICQSLVLKITIAKAFPKFISYGVTSLILTILLSILLDRFIARPIERYRQRRVLRAGLVSQS